MAWRFHGRAEVNPNNPSAFGVCDRCGIWHSLRALSWQMQWSGVKLQNLRLLVCDRCLDVPQAQLKARILQPDPVAIRNPRPELFSVDETTYIVTNDGKHLVTNNGLRLVTNG